MRWVCQGMKFALKLSGNIYNLMRQAGYHSTGKHKKTGELVFVKRISTSEYPRFHAYVKIDKVSQQTFVNLHLDQKKPIYKGSPAHSAEYSGEVVEKEAERIRKLIEGR